MTTTKKEILSRMIERRRDFHRYPETGWAEFRTTAAVATVMESLGWEIQFGGDFIDPETVMGRTIDPEAEMERAISQGADPSMVKKTGGYTGLCAELNTGRPGPTTALRFDIDCVDTNETSASDHLPVQKGFRSQNPGWMHACGHDGHTALGLALAETLTAQRENLSGKIRLLFQPAEEGVRGGYAMTQSGLLDDVDRFVALHLGLGQPTGTIFGGVRGFLCTTKFDVDYTGSGAHAGGEPEKGKNALLAAATAALNLHAIAPHSGGITRLNVGVLNAGEGRNVVPPKAHMKIETRGETNDIANYVYDRAMKVLSGAATMYDVGISVTKRGESIVAESDPELADLVVQAAESVPGVSSAERFRRMAGSDDACWMMQRVQSKGGLATYIGLGATTAAGHHNDRFDFDEKALPIGLELLEKLILKLNIF